MGKKRDALGDRLKMYEPDERFIPGLPVYVRLDGKAFHTFTHGLKRPYDEGLSRLMIAVTKFLVEETGARVGYTQSDEISLLLYAGEDPRSQMIFNGRKEKILSVFASWASGKFTKIQSQFLPGFKEDFVVAFDCKAHNLPSLIEATNAFIWREQDAVKNSISMLAQSEFSHRQLDKKTTKDMIRMLEVERGIFWDTYPSFFKRGTYVQRKTFLLPMETENRMTGEIASIAVERHKVVELEMPILTRIKNRVGVLVFAEEPVTDSQLQEYEDMDCAS